jgi:Asp-tRNA(Asn)/Glu-tRNA(Gln) amidotransferase A subunit family amidase
LKKIASGRTSRVGINGTFDRGQVEVEVEQGAERLETAAETLYKATVRFEKAEEAWERIALIEEARVAQAIDTYGKTSERTRRGLVLKAYQSSDVYLEFVAAKAESNALDKRYRALAAAVNARQSLLKRQS